MSVERSREEVAAVVRDAIEELLEAPARPVTGAARFERDLGMPSVKVVQAITAIQERLEIPPERVVVVLTEVRSVDQLTDAMLRAAGDAAPGAAADAELLASLDRGRRRRSRSLGS